MATQPKLITVECHRDDGHGVEPPLDPFEAGADYIRLDLVRAAIGPDAVASLLEDGSGAERNHPKSPGHSAR